MKFSLKNIINNIYFKNVLLMTIVFLAVVFGTLYWLKVYTRHNQSISVPVLKGLQIEEASAILHSADLRYEVVDSVYEKKGVPGSILEQVPNENTKVKQGRTIYLIVQAKAEQLVSVPDLTDSSRRQAEALLNALGFNNVVIEEVPSEYRGLVLSVEYKGVPLQSGQKIPKGSVLRMKVGSGVGDSAESDSVENIVEIDAAFK